MTVALKALKSKSEEQRNQKKTEKTRSKESRSPALPIVILAGHGLCTPDNSEILRKARPNCMLPVRGTP